MQGSDRDKIVKSILLADWLAVRCQKLRQRRVLEQICLLASFALAPPVCSMPLPATLPQDLNRQSPEQDSPSSKPSFRNRQFALYINDLSDRPIDPDPSTLIHKQLITSPSKTVSPKTVNLLPVKSQVSYQASDLNTEWQLHKTVEPSQDKQARPSLCWRDRSSNCAFAISPTRITQTAPVDPELGILQLRRQLRPGDPELGTFQLKPLTLEGSADAELGIPILREKPLDQQPLTPRVARPPSVYLLLRADYFKTTNVFSGIDPVNDGLIRSGLTLFYAPAIGSQTYLVTSIDASLIRYANLGSTNNRIGSTTFGSLNYNELRFRAGVLQRLSPRMFGEIGWSNQQLFTTKEGLRDALRGDRFFSDHSIRVEFNRQDPLSPSLSLNTFYQFRASFADPSDRDRLIHSLITSLGYSLSPKFQAAIDYQVAWSHFTQQARDDVYQQLVGRLTYTVTPQSQFNVFGGLSFGSSSDPNIDFNGVIVGVGLVVNLPLF